MAVGPKLLLAPVRAGEPQVPWHWDHHRGRRRRTNRMPQRMRFHLLGAVAGVVVLAGMLLFGLQLTISLFAVWVGVSAISICWILRKSRTPAVPAPDTDFDSVPGSRRMEGADTAGPHRMKSADTVGELISELFDGP